MFLLPSLILPLRECLELAPGQVHLSSLILMDKIGSLLRFTLPRHHLPRIVWEGSKREECAW